MGSGRMNLRKDEQRAAREDMNPASERDRDSDCRRAHRHHDGPEFAAALDEAGVTIARATDRDVAALDALREGRWRGSRRIP